MTRQTKKPLHVDIETAQGTIRVWRSQYGDVHVERVDRKPIRSVVLSEQQIATLREWL